jgi:AAA15 family ATPase/GTPase
MSFFGENIFTMKSSADTKFRELNTAKTKYGELLKCAFVLGANGSGKTNFIYAINYMKNTVLAELSLQSRLIANVENFIFSDSSNVIPSVFEVEFIADGIVYEYGFELLNGEVNKEYLYKKTRRKTPVFTRTSPDFKDILLSRDMDNVKELTKHTRRDTLFLYWANGGNNEIAMAVYRWFENIQVFGTEEVSRLLSATIDYLEKNKDGKNNVLSLLQKADINILDFDFELSDGSEQSKRPSKKIKKSYAEKSMPVRTVSLATKHHLYNDKWEKAGVVSTSIMFESAGTRKLFEIAGPIIKALESGAVVFIDEIDSRLHPMLVRYLIMMFNSISKNPKNAQLICNTHDALLLDEDIRRDQVYFTEKDEYGVSKLYSLTDFKGVRKGSKLLKQYLLGAFGATPKLRDYFPVNKV